MSAKSGQYIGVVCQREASTENPKADDLYPIGTVAKVVRILELPDQSITVILQGFCRFELKEIIKSRPYLVASVQKLDDVLPENEDKEFEAMADACKDLTIRYLQSTTAFAKRPLLPSGTSQTAFFSSILFARTCLFLLRKRWNFSTSPI